MPDLDADEQAVIDLARDFTYRDVRPVARDLEHANSYPEKLIAQMKQIGIFGLAIVECYFRDAPLMIVAVGRARRTSDVRDLLCL